MHGKTKNCCLIPLFIQTYLEQILSALWMEYWQVSRLFQSLPENQKPQVPFVIKPILVSSSMSQHNFTFCIQLRILPSPSLGLFWLEVCSDRQVWRTTLHSCILFFSPCPPHLAASGSQGLQGGRKRGNRHEIAWSGIEVVWSFWLLETDSFLKWHFYRSL